jgi:hypothetical protein
MEVVYHITICLAIFCRDIPLKIGLKNRPKIYGIGTSNQSLHLAHRRLVQSYGATVQTDSELSWRFGNHESGTTGNSSSHKWI